MEYIFCLGLSHHMYSFEKCDHSRNSLDNEGFSPWGDALAVNRPLTCVDVSHMEGENIPPQNIEFHV